MQLHQSHRLQTKDHYAKFGDSFQESLKQKIQSLQQICFQRQKKFYLKTCPAKRHVFLLRFIYSQAK